MANRISNRIKKEKDKGLYKQLFSLVLPITLQNLMMSLVSTSDAVMSGMLNQDSLSAVSLATQVAFINSLFFGSFVGGATVLASQYWGKKDEKTVEDVFAVTMRYSLIVGAIFSLLTFLFPMQIMRIFTADVTLIEIGASYLRMASLSYVLTGISQAFLCIMKICEHATLSSLIGSSSVVINIILNAFLVFGLVGFPKMGVQGAALATVIAKAIECVFAVFFMFRGKCIRLRIELVFHSARKVVDSDFWHYTIPLLINYLGWGLGTSMYSVIMGHLGTDATAANSVANLSRSIIASFCWGFASGCGIIIGNLLGRGELEKAKRYGGKFVRASIFIGTCSGLVILALTPAIMHFVKLSDVAKSYLLVMLIFSSYYIIGNSLNSTIISGIFPAGGDTKFGMICDCVTLWAFVVPFGLLAAFVFKWPVLVVAFILTLDEFVKIPAVYKHYMKYKWVRNITRKEMENK